MRTGVTTVTGTTDSTGAAIIGATGTDITTATGSDMPAGIATTVTAGTTGKPTDGTVTASTIIVIADAASTATVIDTDNARPANITLRPARPPIRQAAPVRQFTSTVPAAKV